MKQGKTKIEGTEKNIKFGLTDLTGTTWKWNGPVTGTSVTYNISTEYGTQLYVPFKSGSSFIIDYYYATSNGTYYGWDDYNYWAYGSFGNLTSDSSVQTFTIYGGADVQNATLIKVLNSYATQIR